MESVRNANNFETTNKHRENADDNPVGDKHANGVLRGGRPPKNNKMDFDA